MVTLQSEGWTVCGPHFIESLVSLAGRQDKGSHLSCDISHTQSSFVLGYVREVRGQQRWKDLGMGLNFSPRVDKWLGSSYLATPL